MVTSKTAAASIDAIASPLEGLAEHYDAVVVGSGYGGSIVASRLARAGKRVCLLERGREIRPGEFPDTQAEAALEMQVNAPDAHLGSATGLYDFNVNEQQNVLVGCGLGGTSLINANVALEAKPEVFEQEGWPAGFREHRDTLLKEGLRRAREMLRPTPYPKDRPPLPKLEAHRKSAVGLGAEFYLPPINVNFEEFPEGVNHVGVPQSPCTDCGDCVSGCNYGSKNTLLMNYLPDAANHGAQIFCEVSVRHLQPVEGGTWRVHVQALGHGRDKFDGPEMQIAADVVILSAGTLGSTEILLRSSALGLPLSSKLGQRFSGNGDILGFAFNANQTIHGVGFGTHKPGQLGPVGPCITSIIDYRHGNDWQSRMVIEEGSVPGAIADFFSDSMGVAADVVGKKTDNGVVESLKHKSRRLESALLGPYHGATNNTQTYLIMSHDDADGQLKLEKDRIRVHWPRVGTERNFVLGNQRLLDASKPLGATYVENPIWTKLLRHSLISVHPLGGCCMGEDAERGVVNHKGQVFSGPSGSAVYENLYVTDGSVIPTSLAVNPLLTISAISERCVALLARERGWKIDYTLPSKRSKPRPPTKPGIEFTECMTGYFSTEVTKGDDVQAYQTAEQAGRDAGSTMRFVLTVASDDVDKIVDDPQHPGEIVGTLEASALSPAALTVTQGTFNLFVRYPETPDTRHMVYAMKLSGQKGEQYYFHGYKTIKDQLDAADLWHDTTTLYVTVHRGDSRQGPVVGKGILHIAPADFAKQMTTFRVTGATSELQRLSALAKFGEYFAGTCWATYGGVLAPSTTFNPEAKPRKKRPLRAPTPTLHGLTTGDGVKLRLTRYRGGSKGPVMLVHGLGVASSIFSTDTIATNMVEYLCAHEYDVWLLDFRVSIALPAATQRSNGDQVAKYDFPAAVAEVRRLTGAPSIQAVVHCWGASTFFMSLLSGLSGVRSVVCSQIANNIVVPSATAIKTGLHVPTFLGELGIESLTAYVDRDASWRDKVYDRALRIYAAALAQGWCTNPVCHRVTFMYAPLYRHDKLSDLTHTNLHELFGVANVAAFEHLALLCRRKVLLNAAGEDVYMPNLERLRLPIRFIHGGKNECYLPESTELTFKSLCEHFGPDNYSRVVVPDYGHIDCIFGRDAAVDVYPSVVEHLDATAKA